MREEFSHRFVLGNRTGITPAHAGRIIPRRISGRLKRDHPRACGKNCSFLLLRLLITGSPPRMREELAAVSSSCAAFWITPAHAGRIVSCHTPPMRDWDHPRACGKNIRPVELLPPQAGSPPRMREECHYGCNGSGNGGITPAHAGRIRYRCSRYRFVEDHPRACGKN